MMKITRFLLCCLLIWKASFVFCQATNTVKPLGFSINSEFSETHPLLTSDGKILYFTSTRPLLPAEQKRNVEARANIYRTLFNEDSQAWGEAEPLPELINNTESNNTAFALSNDGQLMLFYRTDSEGKGNVYATNLTGNSWGEPTLISDFGLAASSISGSISSDNKTFYFIGKSELNGDSSDIWTGKISENGSVYEISRMKDMINSADEVASVFMHPDGKTLYFSASTFSDSFDFFSSQLDSTKWKSPLRISEPINSSSFDRDFTMAANGQFAIFASNRNEGKFDLYTVQFSDENAFSPSLTLLNGIVKDAENGQPIGSKINITSLTSQMSFGTFYSNKASGKYLISLPSNGKNYALNILAQNYLLHSENIVCTNSFNELEKIISLQKINIGRSASLKNIKFEEKDAKILPESAIEINQFYLFMVNNPTLKIELSVLFQTSNSTSIDKQLSVKRAEELKNQLVRLGISKKRIKLFKIPKNAKIDGNEGIHYMIFRV
jgi:outer membrane protein OmpA-like peptidoglycan-associated protein